MTTPLPLHRCRVLRSLVSTSLVGLLVVLAGAAPAAGVIGEAGIGGETARGAVTDPAAEPHSLDRIVLIGASATDGFGTQLLARLPDSGRIVRDRTNLEAVLRAALLHEEAELHGFSSSMFFTRPIQMGREQMDAARELEPTVVIAVDYLFWFGYGSIGVSNGTEVETERRLARLERGLAMLDELACPVIVGDMPDMSAAVGFMLSARQMPSPAALAALNARVHAWIAEKDNAHLFPLNDLIADIRAGRTIEIAGRTWDRNEVRRLLSMDALHPTTLGLIATTQMAGQVMAESLDDVAPEHFRTDPKMVLKALHEDLIARTNAREEDRAAPADPEPDPSPASEAGDHVTR